MEAAGKRPCMKETSPYTFPTSSHRSHISSFQYTLLDDQTKPSNFN